MPLRSQAQRRWMRSQRPAMARRWERHTPRGARLPERATKAAFKSTVTTPQHGTLHVERLDQITRGAPATRRRTSELLRRHHLDPATGFSEERVARAGQTDKSIILDEDDNVLDGRHRLVHAHRHGGVVMARVATPAQVAACRTADDGDKSDARGMAFAFDPVAAVRLFDAGKTVHEICRLTGATWAAVRGALLAAGRRVKNPMRGASALSQFVPGGRGVHVRAWYADDAAAARAKSYFEGLLRHRANVSVRPGGELRLATTMPSVLPGVRRRGLHDHASWLAFLREKVEKTGGEVTGSTDSVAANSYAMAGGWRPSANADEPVRTKRDVVRAISDSLRVTQTQAAPVVQATLDQIAEVLIQRGRVELRGFGVFELRTRKARAGVDPSRGHEPIVTPAKVYVSFRPAKAMVTRLRGHVGMSRVAAVAMSLAAPLGGTFEVA